MPSPLSYTTKHLAEKILTSRSALEGRELDDRMAEAPGTFGLAAGKATLIGGGGPSSNVGDFATSRTAAGCTCADDS